MSKEIATAGLETVCSWEIGSRLSWNTSLYGKCNHNLHSIASDPIEIICYIKIRVRKSALFSLGTIWFYKSAYAFVKL